MTDRFMEDLERAQKYRMALAKLFPRKTSMMELYYGFCVCGWKGGETTRYQKAEDERIEHEATHE